MRREQSPTSVHCAHWQRTNCRVFFYPVHCTLTSSVACELCTADAAANPDPSFVGAKVAESTVANPKHALQHLGLANSAQKPAGLRRATVPSHTTASSCNSNVTHHCQLHARHKRRQMHCSHVETETETAAFLGLYRGGGIISKTPWRGVVVRGTSRAQMQQAATALTVFVI